MKRLIFSVVSLLFLLSAAAQAADVINQISQKGDAEWKKLIDKYKSENKFQEPISAAIIANSFQRYKGKYMIFPEVNFDNTFTDQNGTKYFYCKDSQYDGFVIEYNNQITEKLRKYSYVLGSGSKATWQLLGTIDDVYGWWNNVVFMKIVAIHIPGQLTAIIENGNVNFIGEDLINAELAKRSKESTDDIPKNLKEIPKGLEPLVVAKLCFYLSSVENNYDLWLKLLGKDCFWNGKPDSKVESWWNLLKKRKYYFLRIDRDEPTSKRIYFQRIVDGKETNTPALVWVEKENGEWKVTSVNP